MEWISVNEKLPTPKEFDWVLVQVKLVPEGWFGIPHVAELRNGIWFCDSTDKPMENELSVQVTHWMPLPPHPHNQSLTDDALDNPK